MRRTFYGWSLSARTPIISNDPSQSQSRAVASGTASNNNTSVHRSIEQPSATKRSRIDFEDDDNNDLRTSGVGDIDWPDERGSIIDVDEIIESLENCPDDLSLPLELDLQGLQLVDQYGDTTSLKDSQDSADETPLESFADAGLEASTTLDTEDLLLHQLNLSQHPEDDSEPVVHRVTSDPTKFRLAFGIWCEETGISRLQYKSLLEIFGMDDIDLKEEVRKLPAGLSTLKKQAKSQLPLLTLRKKAIPLIPEQLSKDKTSNDQSSTSEGRKSEETLFFFDPQHLFQTLMESDVYNKMHHGIAHWVDDPHEIWHSHSWASSIRTTSGEFAHYPKGSPIFPSDFLSYTCTEGGCDCSSLKPHLGRVYSIIKDFRSRAPQPGAITLGIQRVYTATDLNLFQISPPLSPNEYILSWDMHYVLESDIITQSTNIVLDYISADAKLTQAQQWQPPLLPEQFVIRRVIDTANADSDVPVGQPQQPRVSPLCHCHPSRAELELQVYGRDHLEAMDVSNGRRTICLPLLTFIDGFGLYRNVYRSLMGMYVIPANLSFQDRARRANVFPITLGPHGSNFSDVVNALKSLILLDRGIEMVLPDSNEKVFFCAFTLAFLGDMPQQQENAGFKTQRAKLGCRFCYIDDQKRSDLTYDTASNGRYHFQVKSMREEMNTLDNKHQKELFATKWGIRVDEPPLVKISPALDLILSRPGDPAHSEFQGIAKLMHTFLLEAILTTAACRSYAAELRRFPFPPGWPRVQSPIHHLKSYSISEHARWSIVIPLLLRCWLRESFIQPLFLRALRQMHPDKDALSVIIESFAAAAKSNSVLMGQTVSSRDRESMAEIILDHRTKLQALLSAAANSMSDNPRRAHSVSHLPSRAGTPHLPGTSRLSRAPMPLQRESIVPEPLVAKKAVQYVNDTKKPNMHTALHYTTMAQEYALPSNSNVLIGEDKHRLFKKVIYTTNHRNPEKDLLFKENLRQTIRFVLANAFSDRYPALTKALHELYSQSPTLFSGILPRPEEIEDPNEDDEDVKSDDQHRSPAAIGCIQAKFCRESLNLPTRAVHMETTFRTALSETYGYHYNMPNIVQFRNSMFQWCTKFSFTDPTSERRLTFKRGDFVQTDHPNNGSNRPVRIDQIFVHSYNDERRLFITASRVDNTEAFDEILEYPVLSIMSSSPDKPLIIGLPGIYPRSLYVVPVTLDATEPSSSGGIQKLKLNTGTNEETRLLWAERTLQWL